MNILSGYKYQSCLNKSDGLKKILNSIFKNKEKKIFVDKNNSDELIDAISKIYSENIIIKDITTFIPNTDFSIAIISNPNRYGEILDLENIVSFLHSKNILVALNVDILSLGILKDPSDYNIDLVFSYTSNDNITVFSNLFIEKSIKPSLLDFKILNKKAKITHGITAYLDDALAIYDFHQKNNSYFNKILLSIPETSSFEKIKAADEDNDINIISIDKNNLCLTINETTDIEMVNYILDVFSEATGNFSQELNENIDFTEICSIDEKYLR